MSVRAYVLGDELERYRSLQLAPPPDGLSPEVVLVGPPELASVARALLPDPEPLDVWLARVRAAEAEVVETEPDWEFAEATSRSGRLAGALFAACCALSAALPIVLLVATR